jgi:hypothetical protein
MRTALLSALLTCGAAQAQTFAQVDSIQVHGLVFLGKVERSTYAYGDSVRCQLVVANRSLEPISIPGAYPCDAVFLHESWCDSSGAYWECTPSEPIIRSCGAPPIGGVIMAPGEQIFETRVFGSRRPAGNNWWFRDGLAIFVNPWPTFDPYFEFGVRYRRLPGPTLLQEISWSMIKKRYR